MAKVNGTLIVMQIGGYTIAGQLTSSLDFNVDMLDATTKDSAGSKEYVAGEDDTKINVTGLYDPAAATGAEEMIAVLFAKQPVAWKHGQTSVGGTYWEGDGLINHVGITGDKNVLSNYSIDIQNTGTPTQHAIIGS